jgi:hypothetical protein
MISLFIKEQNQDHLLKVNIAIGLNWSYSTLTFYSAPLKIKEIIDLSASPCRIPGGCCQPQASPPQNQCELPYVPIRGAVLHASFKGGQPGCLSLTTISNLTSKNNTLS